MAEIPVLACGAPGCGRRATHELSVYVWAAGEDVTRSEPRVFFPGVACCWRHAGEAAASGGGLTDQGTQRVSNVMWTVEKVAPDLSSARTVPVPLAARASLLPGR